MGIGRGLFDGCICGYFDIIKEDFFYEMGRYLLLSGMWFGNLLKI